jgi:hypothetical protein
MRQQQRQRMCLQSQAGGRWEQGSWVGQQAVVWGMHCQLVQLKGRQLQTVVMGGRVL